MTELLLAVITWYALGAVAAWWAADRGHERGLWSIAAALWGGATLAMLVLARLAVRLRPATVAGPTPTATGKTVVVALHADDEPVDIAARLRDVDGPIAVLSLVGVVSEEARLDVIATAERERVQESLRRLLRTCPPVPTVTSITALSGLDDLVRRGWRADVVVAGVLATDRPLGPAVARAIDRLAGPAGERSLDPTAAATPAGTIGGESAECTVPASAEPALS